MINLLQGRAVRLARDAHNVEVVGSNPTSATNSIRSIPAFRSETESAKSARPRLAPNAGTHCPEPNANAGACHEHLTPLPDRCRDVLENLDLPARAGPSRGGCSPDLNSGWPDLSRSFLAISRRAASREHVARLFNSGGGLGIHEPRSNQGRARERAMCPAVTRSDLRGLA